MIKGKRTIPHAIYLLKVPGFCSFLNLISGLEEIRPVEGPGVRVFAIDDGGNCSAITC